MKKLKRIMSANEKIKRAVSGIKRNQTEGVKKHRRLRKIKAKSRRINNA